MVPPQVFRNPSDFLETIDCFMLASFFRVRRRRSVYTSIFTYMTCIIYFRPEEPVAYTALPCNDDAFRLSELGAECTTTFVNQQSLTVHETIYYRFTIFKSQNLIAFS